MIRCIYCIAYKLYLMMLSNTYIAMTAYYHWKMPARESPLNSLGPEYQEHRKCFKSSDSKQLLVDFTPVLNFPLLAGLLHCFAVSHWPVGLDLLEKLKQLQQVHMPQKDTLRSLKKDTIIVDVNNIHLQYIFTIISPSLLWISSGICRCSIGRWLMIERSGRRCPIPIKGRW